MPAAGEFPIGSSVTIDALDRDPHPLLAGLRAREPVSWIPALEGWLVTRHDLALEVMRDAARFTVDDARFSTRQVIGPSMLSLDHAEHAAHRAPFVAPFRGPAVSERFARATSDEARRLIEQLRPAGAGELRRSFAAPLAASIITQALGLRREEAGQVLECYDGIVTAVTQITAGAAGSSEGELAFSRLRARLQRVIDDSDSAALLAVAARDTELTDAQIVSNAAVLLFGGIETTEGMIANAVLHLLEHRDALERVSAEPLLLNAAIDESLRLEPAAAVIDRYATTDAELARAQIAAGDLVRISIAGANRDPAVFADPDQFDVDRGNSRRHLAFAQGPHVCVGVHLARLEARSGLLAVLTGLPGLRLDPARASPVRGLVFRKPPALNVVWNT